MNQKLPGACDGQTFPRIGLFKTPLFGQSSSRYVEGLFFSLFAGQTKWEGRAEAATHGAAAFGESRSG